MKKRGSIRIKGYLREAIFAVCTNHILDSPLRRRSPSDYQGVAVFPDRLALHLDCESSSVIGTGSFDNELEEEIYRYVRRKHHGKTKGIATNLDGLDTEGVDEDDFIVYNSYSRGAGYGSDFDLANGDIWSHFREDSRRWRAAMMCPPVAAASLHLYTPSPGPLYCLSK